MNIKRRSGLMGELSSSNSGHIGRNTVSQRGRVYSGNSPQPIANSVAIQPKSVKAGSKIRGSGSGPSKSK